MPEKRRLLRDIDILETSYYLFLSIALFATGVYLLLTRTNPIMALMGVELMFNAANINLVVFGQSDERLEGWFFSLFFYVVVACESVIALAIFYMLSKHKNSPELDQADSLKG